MKQEDERGFLSGKFDDWSGEPIPNGWNALERKLRFRRIKRNASFTVLCLLFFASAIKLFYDASSLRTVGNEIGLLADVSRVKKSNKQLVVTHNDVHEKKDPAMKPERINASVSVTGQMQSGFKSSSKKLSLQNSPDGALALAPHDWTDGIRTYAMEENSSNEVSANPDINEQVPVVEKVVFVPTDYLVPIMLKAPVFQNAPFIQSKEIAENTREKSNISSARPGFSKSFTLQAAYAVSEIQLNHSQTEGWRYGVSGPQFTHAGSISAGMRLERNINRNFALFYGLDAGLWMRRMQLRSASRTPVAYQVNQNAESQYSVEPEIYVQTETRNSMLIFARTEVGIRTAIMRNFGILASGQIWGRIKQKSWSHLPAGADFRTSSQSIAPGYRIGCWLQTGMLSQAELSLNSMPENLAPSTAGIDFKTRTINLGYRQYF